MDRLYAPWRSAYAGTTVRAKEEDASAQECIFCAHTKEPERDEERFILRRFTHTFVMLNLYPYNAGHLLVVPVAHEPQLDGLSHEARTELMELTMHSATIGRDLLEAHGVNIGMNLGKAAGAGIPSHLHQHVLPRWAGDTNYLPLLAGTKQISFDLREMYERLRAAFDQVDIALR